MKYSARNFFAVITENAGSWPLYVAYFTHYTGLTIKNSVRNFSAMNSVITKNAGKIMTKLEGRRIELLSQELTPCIVNEKN